MNLSKEPSIYSYNDMPSTTGTYNDKNIIFSISYLLWLNKISQYILLQGGSKSSFTYPQRLNENFPLYIHKTLQEWT